jgi:hypothetical protein
MKAKRKYKDSVFTLLFNDKKRLLELYNAVNGTSFTNEDDIEINTLQNAHFGLRAGRKVWLRPVCRKNPCLYNSGFMALMNVRRRYGRTQGKT